MTQWRQKVCIIFMTLLMQGGSNISFAQTPPCPRERTDPKISKDPAWMSAAHGLVETGLLAVPFDRRTGLRDLVVASGNDVYPQPIAIHRNRRYAEPNGFTNPEPDWVSQHVEMHGHIGSGDLDKDGLFDLAVAIFADHPPLPHAGGSGYRYKPGGVDIYRGVGRCQGGAQDEDCTLHPAFGRAPQLQIRQGFGATAVSLGDVDGNGSLDLAVAVAYEADRFEIPADGIPSHPGRLRVFFNRDGTFDLEHPWMSEGAYNAGDVELADVNQDGLLDLVVGTDRVLIFFGTRAGDLTTLEPVPGWMSDPEANGSYIVSVETGSLVSPRPDGQWLHIAAGSSCLFKNNKCPGRFAVFSPGAGRTGQRPIWTSSPDFEGWAGEVRLRDHDDDCRVDLVASSWWEWGNSGPVVPSRLRIYPGVGLTSAPTLGSAPIWSSNDLFVGQSIELTDFNCRKVVTRTETFEVPRTPYTVTLRDSEVERIERATMRTAAGLDIELDILPVVSERHVTLTNLDSAAHVTIEFTRSPLFDVAVGAYEVDKGVRLYLSDAGASYTHCLGR